MVWMIGTAGSIAQFAFGWTGVRRMREWLNIVTDIVAQEWHEQSMSHREPAEFDGLAFKRRVFLESIAFLPFLFGFERVFPTKTLLSHRKLSVVWTNRLAIDQTGLWRSVLDRTMAGYVLMASILTMNAELGSVRDDVFGVAAFKFQSIVEWTSPGPRQYRLLNARLEVAKEDCRN